MKMTKEDAIYILRNTAWLAPSLEPVDEAIDMAIEALENERPKGHWIYEEGTYKLINLWQCSECYEVVDEKTNYCPECGSDMRGDEQ